MNEKESRSRLLEGAFILSAAAVGSKLIGTLQKIPLQNMGGDAVFGIYNTVYPLYLMMITVAGLGFPAAVSKFVAEYEAAGRTEDSRRLLRLSTVFLVLFGFLLGAAMFFGAPLLGRWIGSPDVVPSLKAAAMAFLFVPWMALLRGYFQGRQNMVPTAVSQMIEQTARVAVMIILLVLMIRAGAGAEEIAAGALFGSAAGGAAGLIVMLLYLRKHVADKGYSGVKGRERAPVRSLPQGDRRDDRESSARMLRKLAAYAIPVCLSALAVPLIGLVDTFTVPRLLKGGGLPDGEAMSLFGIYNRGLPLVQLVTMLATSLSVLFIPALAESKFKRENRLAERQCRLALRWFWLLGLAASVGLAVLAEPVNIMLYEDTAGTDVMRWIAFTAAGGTMSIITAALLQGLGIVKAPAASLAAAAMLKLGLNLWLVPELGIEGAAIAGVAAHAAAAALNTALLVRQAGVKLDAAHLLAKPALLLAGLALAAWAAAGVAGGLVEAAGLGHGRLSAGAASLAGVAAGSGAFLAGAALTKLLSEEELQLLPKVGRPLAKLLRRLRLLR